jgi:NAD(P)-dependent dehydrogenase (short-subunit alcohol dehydrogenase family)
MRLKDKIGIVTAAGSGMGRAGAIRFAKEGAKVAVADLDGASVESVVKAITAAGGQAIGVTTDLREAANARRGYPHARTAAVDALRALVAFASYTDTRLALQLRLALLLETTAVDSTDARSADLLFREALELGYLITPVYQVSAFVDHVSNGGLAKQNQSINDVGVRLGVRF